MPVWPSPVWAAAAAAPAGMLDLLPHDVAGSYHPSWLATLSAAPPAALPRRGRRRFSHPSPSAAALCNSWDEVFAKACRASRRSGFVLTRSRRSSDGATTTTSCGTFRR